MQPEDIRTTGPEEACIKPRAEESTKETQTDPL